METDSRLKLKGNQIKHLTGKKVFRDVEELIITDANTSEIGKASDLASLGWFPGLKTVTVRINTARFWSWREMQSALTNIYEPLEIDLRGCFSKYNLDVKVKTDECILYSSNMKNRSHVMTLNVITDNGTRTYKFNVSE